MLQNEEEAGEFVVRLCHDVLLEVLFFGDRCQLTKSERIGRLFHRIIEDYREFKESPFLRLRLRLAFPYFHLSTDPYRIYSSITFIKIVEKWARTMPNLLLYNWLYFQRHLYFRERPSPLFVK